MTMKAYAYIYTRTLHIDYNVFTMPSSQVLASSVAEDFENQKERITEEVIALCEKYPIY